MFEHQDIIGQSKVGPDGCAKLVSTVDIMQDCSLMWLDSEPDFMRTLIKNGWAMIMAARQVDVYRMPMLGESLTVRTWIYECKVSFGYRNTAIYDAQGNLCIASWNTGVFTEIESRKIIRIPQEIVNGITYDKKLDMEYLPKKIKVKDMSFVQRGSVPVRRADIDSNKHVNNARYVEIALDALPDDFVPKRFRIEYKTPAYWGDSMYMHYASNSSNICTVMLCDEAGNPYAIVEFSCAF